MITKKEGKSLGINPLEKWPSLNSLIEIQSQRINAITGVVSEEKQRLRNQDAALLKI